MLVLVAPVYAGVASDVVGQYSDPVTQMIIYLMLPALAILFIFVGLFFDDGGGHQYGYR